MIDMLLAVVSCLILGILSTIHPCPLSTNTAALSMILSQNARKNQGGHAFFFVIGYVISLAGVAWIVNIGISSIPRLSMLLQNGISLFLGPGLILVGMIVTGLIQLDRFYISPKINTIMKTSSSIYVFLVSMVLALAFCPATASVFFGALIPLSIKYEKFLLFPAIYAFGAVLPILMIAYLLRRGFGQYLKKEWAKSITTISGYLIIATGVYISIQKLYLPWVFD